MRYEAGKEVTFVSCSSTASKCIQVSLGRKGHFVPMEKLWNCPLYIHTRVPKDIADFHVLLSDSGWMQTDTFEDFIEHAFDNYLVENNIK